VLRSLESGFPGPASPWSPVGPATSVNARGRASSTANGSARGGSRATLPELAPTTEPVPCPLCRGTHDRELLVAGRRRLVRCESCGLVFRNPRPPVPAYTEEFGSGRAEVTDEAWLGARRSRTFARFLGTWPGRPGRLLDVGCGGGWFLKAATERGWAAVGVDPSPEAVRRAREDLGVDARQGLLEAQDFAPASFDLVTLWNVIEIVPEPFALVRTIEPLLKPGGTLHLRTQNFPFQRMAFGATRAARRLGFGRALDRRPHLAFVFHVTAFSAATIRVFLERAGFTDVRVVPSSPAPGDPYRILRSFAEWPLSVAKAASDRVARAAWAVSGRRWIASASFEASARRP
jgi:SAM-dependent methyltransferase